APVRRQGPRRRTRSPRQLPQQPELPLAACRSLVCAPPLLNDRRGISVLLLSYSTAIPAALTTLAKTAVSERINSRNCSGVLVTVSTPDCASLSFRSGD